MKAAPRRNPRFGRQAVHHDHHPAQPYPTVHPARPPAQPLHAAQHECADDRADRKEREHEPQRLHLQPQVIVNQERQGDGSWPGIGHVDEGEDQDRHPQPGGSHHCAQSIAHVRERRCLLLRRRGREADEAQGNETRRGNQEGKAVEPKGERGPARRDDDRAERRPDDAGKLPRQAGERVGARQVLERHHLRDRRVVGGQEERLGQTEDHAYGVDVPQREPVGVGQQRHQPDHARADDVGSQHDAEARQPVDDHAAHKQEEQHRDKREDGQRAHRSRRACLLEDPPREGDVVQGIAQARDGLPGPQQGEGTDSQCAQEAHGGRLYRGRGDPKRAGRLLLCDAQKRNPSGRPIRFHARPLKM